MKVSKFLGKLEKQCVSALQMNAISLTEGTKRSLPVKEVNKCNIFSILMMFVLLLLQVNKFFSCDFNFLYEYLISGA